MILSLCLFDNCDSFLQALLRFGILPRQLMHQTHIAQHGCIERVFRAQPLRGDFRCVS